MNIQAIKDRIDLIEYDYSSGEHYKVLSGKEALETNYGNCISGAFAAALLLEQQNHPIYMLDLLGPQECHCVTLYTENHKYGAIGQSMYETLKHKDAIYNSIHELVIEYALATEKTGHEITRFRIVDLKQLAQYINWRTDTENLDKKGVNQLLSMTRPEKI